VGCAGALGDITWPIVRDKVDTIITVTEQAILHSMQLLMDKAKLVVEPSGAAALAAVLSDQFRAEYGALKNVAVVVSGGNVDFERVGFWRQWGECTGANVGL
jgi:threonine dehydratase